MKLFVRSLTGILAFFSLLFVLYIVDKGFRFSDEGYYLAGYVQGQTLGVSMTYFHSLVRCVFQDYAVNIIFLRVSRLVLSIIAIFFIARSLCEIREGVDLMNLYSLLFIGVLCGYAIGPQSLSYNTMNFFFLSSFLFAFVRYAYKGSIGCLVTLGLITSLIVLVKITSAVALFFFLCLFIILFSENRWFHLLCYSSILLFSLIILNKVLSINLFFSFYDVLSFMGANKTSHGGGMLINSFKGLILQTSKIGLFIAIFLGVVFLLNYFKLRYSQLWSVIVLVFLTSTFYSFQIRDSRFIVFFISSYIFYTALDNGDLFSVIRTGLNRKVVLISFVFLLPFIGALGSDIGMYRNALFYLPFWILLFFYFNFQNKYGFYVVALAVLTFSLSVYTIYFNPFRAEDVRSAKYPISCKQWPNTKVKVSESQYIKLGVLRQSLAKNNSFVFGMNDNIGYLFFLGKLQSNGFCFSYKNLPLYLHSRKQTTFKEEVVVLNKSQLDTVIPAFKFDLFESHMVMDLPSGVKIFYPKQKQ